MNDPMLPLSGLSPVAGKKVVVKFDGGLLSSDGGIVVLREVEQRLRVSDRMAACLVDPQAYLTDVLTKLVNLWPASRLDELMPWAWAAERAASRRAA
jgi:hypothetical protein